MSKSSSHLFVRTRGHRISQGINPEKQREKVTFWAEKIAEYLEKKSKRQRDKFKTACVAFDEKTGRMFFGRNGGINKSATNVKKNDILFGEKGILPKQSLNGYPTPWNCAETDAINKALNAGAKLRDIHIYTISTTENSFGKDKPSCINCTTAYKGRIKQNNTGWEQ